MMQRIAESSPRLKAKIAGLCYLITIVTGIFGEGFVRGKLIVYSDAATTAHNIFAHQSLYRFGVATDLLPVYLIVTILFYDLFKPVSRTVSLLAAFFSLIGCAMGALSALLQLAPLVALSGESYLSAFNPEQLQSIALLFLKLRLHSFNICLVFFGFYCLLIGILILKSTFLPRILGVLMALAGLAYAGNSFAIFLSPVFAAHLFPYILAPGLIGEASLTFWLLIRGVDIQRWIEQTEAAA
jgi:hypothetical protein